MAIKNLSDKEFNKLEKALPYLPVKHAALISILIYCGLRVGELVRLQLRDIELVNGMPRMVNIRGATTKTRKGRDVAIPFKAAKLVSAYFKELVSRKRELQKDDYLFQGRRDRSYLSSRAVQSYIEKTGDHLLKRHITPHMLRHTYATMLLKNTSTRQVQMLLGHSKLSSTEIYTHPTNEDLTATVDRTFSTKKIPKK